MCDKCISNESDYPTAARPLTKYDYAVLTFGTLYNISLVALEFFGSLVKMAKYQASVEASHADAWAQISMDLEKLEAQDG